MASLDWLLKLRFVCCHGMKLLFDIHKKSLRIKRCGGFFIEKKDYPKNPNRMPAATAEPITPATLGPMACISR